MTVKELNREQLIQLKQNFLDEENYRNGEGTSYGELAAADELVSDETIFNEYSGYVFSEDDFWRN